MTWKGQKSTKTQQRGKRSRKTKVSALVPKMKLISWKRMDKPQILHDSVWIWLKKDTDKRYCMFFCQTKALFFPGFQFVYNYSHDKKTHIINMFFFFRCLTIVGFVATMFPSAFFSFKRRHCIKFDILRGGWQIHSFGSIIRDGNICIF